MKKSNDNARFPSGKSGILTLQRMNKMHNIGSLWAIEKIKTNNENIKILDVGCGGGQNLLNFAEKFVNAKLFGIDYSPTSIKFCAKNCKNLIGENRLKLELCDIHKTNFKECEFDIVSAFETLYFWKNLDACFAEIKRILKLNGLFFIFLEGTTKETLNEWNKSVELANMLTCDELVEILQKNDFKNVEFFTLENSEKSCFLAYKK